MAAAAAPAITDQRQRELIAMELNLKDNAEFEAFLRGVWIKNDWYSRIHPELQFLHTKRAAINWLLGRNWDKRDIKLADIQRKDGSIPKALAAMLTSVQYDIDVLLARTGKSAFPQSALIPLGTTLPGPIAGAIGGAIGTGTVSTGALPPTTPTVTELPEDLIVYTLTIQEGGFSQQVLPENPERTYLRIRNLSEGDLWYAFGVDATTGTPSVKLTRKTGFYLKTGAGTPGDSLHIVGATDGQLFEVAAD